MKNATAMLGVEPTGLSLWVPGGAWVLDLLRPAALGASGEAIAKGLHPAGTRYVRPFGGRAEVPARFVIGKAAPAAPFARPSLEYGIQTPDLHEYFLGKGGGMSGIVLVRRKDDGWSASVAKTLLPTVLTKDAVTNGWMPAEGTSGLPASLERVVPPQYRYWKRSGTEAEAVRNALVEASHFDERLIKVVDGELRLCAEKLYLYEPEWQEPPAGAPATKAVAKSDKALVSLGATMRAIFPPDVSRVASLNPSAPTGWQEIIQKNDRPEAFWLVSPASADVPPAALADALAVTKGEWLVETDDTAEARSALAKIARPFTLATPGAEGRLFAASYAVVNPAVVFNDASAGAADRRTVAKLAGVSFNTLRDLLDSAIRLAHPPTKSDDGPCSLGPYVRDLYDDAVVYDTDGKTWREGFTYAAGAVTLDGAPVQVVQTFVPATAQASADAGEVGKMLRVVKSASDERYVLGIVLEPEVIDAQEDIYDTSTIAKAAHDFMERHQNVGLMHQGHVNEKVKILESYLAPADMLVGETPVKKGTWLMAVRVLDDGLWSDVKKGGLTGFSIGGSAIRQPDPEAKGISPMDALKAAKLLKSESVAKIVPFAGLQVHIDRPAGFVQKGTDASGAAWERTYTHDYGFLKGTDGGDDEELDVFLGADATAADAYWVHQKKADGSFDEFKVFLGFPSAADARAVYLAHIPQQFMGGMTSMPVAQIKSLLGLKPFEIAKRLGRSGRLAGRLTRLPRVTHTQRSRCRTIPSQPRVPTASTKWTWMRSRWWIAPPTSVVFWS